MTTPGGTSVDNANAVYTYIAPITETFAPTEANQTFTAPLAGTINATVNGSSGGWGGAGAKLKGSFAIAAGEQLTIVVGSLSNTYAGSGLATQQAGSPIIFLNGGGYSAIFKADAAGGTSGKLTVTLPSSILILSGGGGGGGQGHSYLAGNAGGWNPASNPASSGGNGGNTTGGTTTSNQGSGTPGQPYGSQFQGGAAATGAYGGGGGGGGYYGGGGGFTGVSYDQATGAGGSSYVGASVTFESSELNVGTLGSITLTFTPA